MLPDAASQPVSDDHIVTLQARAIVDLEQRVADLEAQLDSSHAESSELQLRIEDLHRQIETLQQHVHADQELLREYQRSRAVRIAAFFKRWQGGSTDGVPGAGG